MKESVCIKMCTVHVCAYIYDYKMWEWKKQVLVANTALSLLYITTHSGILITS